jgi:hypothetical protein
MVLEARSARRTSTPRCRHKTRSLPSGLAHHKSYDLALERLRKRMGGLVLEGKWSTGRTWTSIPKCRAPWHDDCSLLSGLAHHKASNLALEHAAGKKRSLVLEENGSAGRMWTPTRLRWMFRHRE